MSFFLFFLVFSGPKGRMQRIECYHAPREGCRELNFIICFSSCQSMHMSKQRICKEECKKRILTVPCSESGELRECLLFIDVISRYHIYANDIATRSHLYDIYISQKFHPTGSQEIKHIAHAQRETI